MIRILTRMAPFLLFASGPLIPVPPMQFAVDETHGQVPGATGVGDSTIVDGQGVEGNFHRIKTHLDYFDWTNWGPDPALGVLPTAPLPPHTLELRDSSGNVLLRYMANGSYDSEGVFDFAGAVNAGQTVGVGAGGFRQRNGHMQWSDDRQTWHNFYETAH